MLFRDRKIPYSFVGYIYLANLKTKGFHKSLLFSWIQLKIKILGNQDIDWNHHILKDLIDSVIFISHTVSRLWKFGCNIQTYPTDILQMLSITNSTKLIQTSFGNIFWLCKTFFFFYQSTKDVLHEWFFK